MKPLLEVSHLHFAFESERKDRKFQLEVESLDVKPGEIHSVLGPNGSGKSTLLRLLAGLLPAEAGSIRLLGRDSHAYRDQERAQSLAFLPQKIDLRTDMTVMQIVLMGRFPWSTGLGLPAEVDLQFARDVMRRMKVDHLQDRRALHLSGGEFQRVWLASILAQKPKVILLDEPTHWLDIHHQIECFQLLREEIKRGVGVLVTTHDLNMAGHFSDCMTLMKAGKVLVQGSPRVVLDEKWLKLAFGEPLRVVSLPGEEVKTILPDLSVSDVKQEVKAETLERSGLGKSLRGIGFFSFFRKTIPFFLVLLGVMVMAPWFGSEEVDVFKALHEMRTQMPEQWSVSTEIFQVRLPRVGMALLAGMALACTGAAFQSLLRNPLAEPFTLGTASAASLGAVIALSVPALTFQWGPFSGTQAWAFVFALLNTALLWMLSRGSLKLGGMTSLLLTGITLGLISSACILLIRFLASPLTTRAMDQWMVGGVEVTHWRQILPAIPLMLSGLVLILFHMNELNHMELGQELAASRGIDVPAVRRAVLIGGALVTASVVSIVGPIGFIGLIVPYLVRKMVGTDLRLVLPCSLLGGGIALVGVDTLARSITLVGRGAELPVGVITSLVGGMVFLILFIRKPGAAFD